MFVTVNGARLFFDVINPKLAIGADDALTEKPTLICIPGGPGGDHQTLRPTFDWLSAQAQVIYLDPRGTGRSDPGDSSTWTLDQWGDDIAAFADALGIAKPIVLGISGGAIMTAAYLTRHPQHAGGAVLINACARLVKDDMIAGFGALGGAAAADAARNMYDRGGPEDFPPFFQHCFPHYMHRKGGGGGTPMPGGTRAAMNFALTRHFFTVSAEAFAFDFRAKLADIACPVLALVGAHDPVTRAEWGREVAAAMKAGLCDYVEFADSSHMIMMDEPEKFWGAIDGFMKARG